MEGVRKGKMKREGWILSSQSPLFSLSHLYLGYVQPLLQHRSLELRRICALFKLPHSLRCIPARSRDRTPNEKKGTE